MKKTQPPQYSESLLIRLIRETKTLTDLTELCNLYRDLEEQKDLVITHKVTSEVQLQSWTILYSGDSFGKTNEES